MTSEDARWSTSPSGRSRMTSAIVDGALRAPWKWETLIVESAVIGGDPGALASAARRASPRSIA